MLDLKPEFSKYRYVIDTGSDGKDRFSVFRFDENITSKVMNNVLLDLMMAYEQLNDKLSDIREPIEQGKKIETKSSEKTFKCACCNCKWTAESYVMIRTPMKPNAYCWCPNCGNQTWEQED